jgi:hypothetical protein
VATDIPADGASSRTTPMIDGTPTGYSDCIHSWTIRPQIG